MSGETLGIIMGGSLWREHPSCFQRKVDVASGRWCSCCRGCVRMCVHACACSNLVLKHDPRHLTVSITEYLLSVFFFPKKKKSNFAVGLLNLFLLLQKCLPSIRMRGAWCSWKIASWPLVPILQEGAACGPPAQQHLWGPASLS